MGNYVGINGKGGIRNEEGRKSGGIHRDSFNPEGTETDKGMKEDGGEYTFEALGDCLERGSSGGESVGEEGRSERKEELEEGETSSVGEGRSRPGEVLRRWRR